jgi:hypothetical protein
MNRKLGKIGDVYGYYTVIDDEVEVNKDGKVKYHVQCACGKVEFVRGYFLRIGRQKSCKSCRSKINYKIAFDSGKKIGFIKRGHEGIGNFTKTVYSVIKRNATRRKLIWSNELTIEYLWNLYNQQNKKCALSGLDISFTEKRVNNIIDYRYMTASLDRINSKIGYTKDNVQWVHKDINTMKFDYDQEYFINMCKLIVEHNK